VPSSTRARWRTRRASPSWRPTCSAPRSRRRRERRRDDPARARAHVVRRPRHHALVDDCGSTRASPPTPRSWRRPKPRASVARGRHLQRVETWAYARTAADTHPSRPIWSTPSGPRELRRHHLREGASVLRQLVAWWVTTRSGVGARTTSTPRMANTELADFLAALEETSGETRRLVRPLARDRGVNNPGLFETTAADGEAPCFRRSKSCRPPLPNTVLGAPLAIGSTTTTARGSRVASGSSSTSMVSARSFRSRRATRADSCS